MCDSGSEHVTLDLVGHSDSAVEYCSAFGTYCALHSAVNCKFASVNSHITFVSVKAGTTLDADDITTTM